MLSLKSVGGKHFLLITFQKQPSTSLQINTHQNQLSGAFVAGDVTYRITLTPLLTSTLYTEFIVIYCNNTMFLNFFFFKSTAHISVWEKKTF